MADIERYGRTFTFDDNVSDAQRDQRVQNWMQKHAADELKEKATPVSSPALPAQLDVPDVSKRQSGTNAYNSESVSDKIAQSFGHGATMGFGDEATAFARAVAPGFANWMMEPSAWEKSTGKTGQTVSTAPTFQGRYDDELARERDKAKRFSETNPILSGASEIAGSLATLPLGVRLAGTAAKALPGGARLAALIAAHPFLASIGTGAVAGGVSSFGSGEDGVENRLENAAKGTALGAVLGPAAYGATKAIHKGANWLSSNTRVAEYLTSILGREKKLDPDSPTFIPDAMRKLRTEMTEQQRLKTDPMAADLLPAATEASLTKPGKGSSDLAESLYKRQYDKELTEAAARDQSQFGRLHDSMDHSFGPDVFKGTDEQLISARRANAQPNFATAYAQNIRSAGIDDALDRLGPNVANRAAEWARMERRPIGTFDAQGNIVDYNTQYLHDIKRAMDEHLGEQGRMNPKFNDMPYKRAKDDLNKAMMDVNDPYKQAMLKYGEDSGLMNALKKGREEIFAPGSVDKTGMMDKSAIKDYLADPNIPQAQKDLFLVGGARTVREKFLGSDSKKFTHNWADFVNNPKNEENLNALVNGKQLGSWDLFRAKLKQESTNYQNATRATGNSRTAARLALQEEASGAPADAMSALGLMINPKSPGGWRGMGQSVVRAIDPASKVLNKTASILAKRGPTGNRESLDEIERLLNETAARNDRFKRLGRIVPSVTAGTLPYRND